MRSRRIEYAAGKNGQLQLSFLYTVEWKWRLKSNHRSCAVSNSNTFTLNLNESGNQLAGSLMLQLGTWFL